MLSDLPESEGRAWYARTLAAADSLAGLGRAASWASRPVSAGSLAARRRVAAYLRRLAAGVKAGRVRARDFRRLRAFLLGSLDAASAAGGGGGSGGGGGPGGAGPSSAQGGGADPGGGPGDGGPSIGPGSVAPSGSTGVSNPSAAANTIVAAYSLPVANEW